MARPAIDAYVTPKKLDLVGLRRAVDAYDPKDLGEKIALVREAEDLLGSQNAQKHYGSIIADLTTGLQERVRERVGHTPERHASATIGEVYEHLDEAIAESAIDVLEKRLGLSMKAERAQPHSDLRTRHVLSLVDRYLAPATREEQAVTGRLREAVLMHMHYADPDDLKRPVDTLYKRIERFAAGAAKLPETTAAKLMDSYGPLFERLGPKERHEQLLGAAQRHKIALAGVGVGDAMAFSPTMVYELAAARDDYQLLRATARQHGVERFIDFDAMFSEEERSKPSQRTLSAQEHERLSTMIDEQLRHHHATGGREAAADFLRDLRRRGIQLQAADEEVLDGLDATLKEIVEDEP